MSEIGPGDVQLFALSETGELGSRVANSLGIELSGQKERFFEDGEHKTRPLENVRGRDVYIVQSLHSDADHSVNDKLCRLLFFLGSLRDAGAGRLTAVLPYLCYARKDRKTKPRDPVTTRYVAAMVESVGVDRVVTMDVHNLAAYQNAFRIPTEHLEARRLFAEHFVERLGDRHAVVVSPDVGGVKRAQPFQETLAGVLGRDIPLAFMEKQRSMDVVSGEAFVGDVQDRVAIIVDDMISSGTTLARAAQACRERGAETVWAAATHGVFVGKANDVLADPALESIVVTSSVPPFRITSDDVRSKITVIDAAPFLAEAIPRLHDGGSIVDLNEPGPQPHTTGAA